MRLLPVLAVLIGLGAADAWLPSGVHARAAALPFQSVTGTASVDLREQTGADVQYRVTINAFEDAEDGFQGTVTSRIVRGEQGSLIVLSRVACVMVSGNSAWIGSIVTHSTNEAVLSAGDLLITYVRDFGDTDDVVHQEAAKNLPPASFDTDSDGDVDCHDRPLLYPSTVETGNIVIK